MALTEVDGEGARGTGEGVEDAIRRERAEEAGMRASTTQLGNIQAGKARREALGLDRKRVAHDCSLQGERAEVPLHRRHQMEALECTLGRDESPHGALDRDRRIAGPEAIELQRVEGQPGGEDQGVGAGIEHRGTVGTCLRQVTVAMAQGAPIGHLMPGSLQDTDKPEPAAQVDAWRDPLDGPQVDIPVAHDHGVEDRPLDTTENQVTLSDEVRHRAALDHGVTESQVGIEIDAILEAGTAESAVEGSVERNGVEIGPRDVEIEPGEIERHVFDAQTAMTVDHGGDVPGDSPLRPLHIKVTDGVRRQHLRAGTGGDHGPPGHRGEIGRHPVEVAQIQPRRRHREVVQHGAVGPGDDSAAREAAVGHGRPVYREAEAVIVGPGVRR